ISWSPPAARSHLTASVAKSNSVVFSARDRALPTTVSGWLSNVSERPLRVTSADEMMALALRGRPRVVAFDAREDATMSYDACRRLKADSYTGVVPCFIVVGSSAKDFRAAFESGADEVVRSSDSAPEITIR